MSVLESRNGNRFRFGNPDSAIQALGAVAEVDGFDGGGRAVFENGLAIDESLAATQFPDGKRDGREQEDDEQPVCRLEEGPMFDCGYELGEGEETEGVYQDRNERRVFEGRQRTGERDFAESQERDFDQKRGGEADNSDVEERDPPTEEMRVERETDEDERRDENSEHHFPC